MRPGLKTLGFVGLLAGCVNQADLDSWAGQPSYLLDRHPLFLTMTLVRTMSSDGLEIRNYVNGDTVGSCGGAGTLSDSAYTQFLSCSQRQRACNNIFYIRDGKVLRYLPTASGGAICYTDSSVRPIKTGLID